MNNLQKRKICFTVSNDVSYDQRMEKICTSLSKNGFEVLLMGRIKNNSKALTPKNYRQKRLNCFLQKGFFFYMEFNLQLFLQLLFTDFDIICAIDLDTILPCYFVSAIKHKIRVYDAHELFTEQKEIVTRKNVQFVWNKIEALVLPRFNYGYTVNDFIQTFFQKRYGVSYEVIRNLPNKQFVNITDGNNSEHFIIYQGAVNEGRSFETIIPAMKNINSKLFIFGEGNFFTQTRQLIKEHSLEDKVFLKGNSLPADLKIITPQALFGLTVFEATGLNQIHSLSNRFFDYIMAGIPQVCIAFPEYKQLNDIYHVALMITDTDAASISNAMNKLLADTVLYQQLKQNCLKAREVLNWEYEEEPKLLNFYHHISK
jgi:glycosyltransferase involved in cell wall biosynthesis